MNIDVTKILKIAGLVMSIVGTIATSVASSRENSKTLEKLVNDHFENQN